MDEINTSRILPIDINQEMQKSFISYAMAVIINRALPDVRDGLKPVHRRILYSMHELGVTPDKPHKKSVTIVGDVLGKYHPHGDRAVYDALVRLAQPFSMRYMLADGHGNFGSVDGDGAAAMRYTEARMGRITLEMLRDLDKDTVDFYPNFDETLMQPVTLPSRFPNILVNGTGGIAVGMATNIPPHNLGEVIDATVALMDDPDIDIDGLMEHVKGPDFPTGGVIAGLSGIRQAYRTGRGKVRIRAKHEIEVEKDGSEKIIVTEIPYQVNKEALVASINDYINDKKIEGVTHASDHSDKSGMRVEIGVKRGFSSSVVLNQLYKHTQLQETFGVIMLALVDGEPRVLNLKEVLEEYVKYQCEVIERRTRYDLEKAQRRAHILEGLLKALDIIDEVVHTIRASKDAPTARFALMDNFGFTEVQAQTILEMRLQRLTGLERDRLENEYKALLEQIDYYKRVLADRQMVLGIIKEDLLQIKAKYDDGRRTEIQADESDIDLEELIQEETMVVTLTNAGYIKRMSTDNYRQQRRGGRGVTGLTTRDEDFVKDVFVSSTHDDIIYFTNRGRCFRQKCYRIPEAGRAAKGTAIVNLLNLGEGEVVTTLFPISDMEEDSNLVMVTKQGFIKKTHLSQFSNIRQSGIIAIGLREEDFLISVLKTTGKDVIIVGTKDGMSITFDEEDVRPMGRTATGVRAITLRDEDEVVGVCKIRENAYVLTVSENGYGKLTATDEFRQQTRGGIGIKAMQVTEKTGLMCGLVVVDGMEDLLLINDANVIIRMNVQDISIVGRAAQGVRLMKVEDDAKVVGIAILNEGDEQEGETEE
ncbi:MAG: DNA gyrase subunit A [Christensenellaceae bacterium]|nr:DNA gyrase subunit A [Christensenellaceae bacterium]